MIAITRYRDWAPTQFDPKGLGGDRLGIGDWIVAPVITTRDSGALSESNFETFKKILDDAKVEYQEHRFNHWGPGYFTIILVKPTDKGIATVEETLRSLDDYPILDEDDYSEREWDEICEAWSNTDTRERIEILARHSLSIFAARRDEVPQGLPYYEDFYVPGEGS